MGTDYQKKETVFTKIYTKLTKMVASCVKFV
jgi:hypothetical protein